MDKRALPSGRRSNGVETLQTWQTESWSFSLSLQPSYQHLSQYQLLSVLPFPSLQQNFALEGEEEKTSEHWKKQKSEKKGEGPEWWPEKGKVHFGFTLLSNIRAGSLTENLSLMMCLVWPSPLATWAPHHLPHRIRDFSRSLLQIIQSMKKKKKTKQKSQWNPASNSNQLQAIIKLIFLHASKIPQKSVKRRLTKVAEERTEKQSLETRAEINVITSSPLP